MGVLMDEEKRQKCWQNHDVQVEKLPKARLRKSDAHFQLVTASRRLRAIMSVGPEECGDWSPEIQVHMSPKTERIFLKYTLFCLRCFDRPLFIFALHSGVGFTVPPPPICVSS